MGSGRIRWVAALFFGVMAWSLPAAAEGPNDSKPVGIVVAVRGEALILAADGAERQAGLRSVVYVGDRVETAVGTYIQIDFLDGSKVSLAGSSDLTIDDYVFRQDTGEASSEVSIDNGAMSFMAGKIGKIAPQNYKINTAFAIVGIRGSSGEIQTSDGNLPGVRANLIVAKTGGEGLLIAPMGAPSNVPPQVITETGRGIVFDGQGATKQVRLSGSVVTNYTNKHEKKFAQGRQTAKLAQKKQDKKSASHHGKSTNSGSSAGRKQPSSPDAPLGGGQGGEEYDQDGVAPGGVNGGDEPSGSDFDDRFLGGGDDDDAGLKLDVVDDANSLQVATDDPNVDTSADMTAVTKDASLLISQSTESDNDDLVQKKISGDSGSAPPAPDWESIPHGYGIAVEGDGSSTTDLFSSVDGGRVSRNLNTVETAWKWPAWTFSWDGLVLGTSYSTAQYFEETSSNGVTRMLYGTPGRFFIVDEYSYAPGDAFWSSMFFGSIAGSASMPTSGVLFYSSDIDGASSAISANTDWVTASLLVSNGKILNPGFAFHAMVDFDRRIVGGITTLPGRATRTGSSLSPGLAPKSQPGFDRQGARKGFLPFTLYYGEVGPYAEIHNGHLFLNMGFMPLHVNLGNGFDPMPAPYGLQRTRLDGCYGLAWLFGREVEGIGIEMNDGSNNFFTAAAFHDDDKTDIPGTDGTYTGFGRGIRVDGPNYDTILGEQFSAISLDASFTNRTVSGTVTVANHGTVSIGSRNFAIDREIVVGELTGTDAGLPVAAGTSFIMTVDLPYWAYDIGGAAPSDVFWGCWNIVENNQNDSVYPGQHNFWVVGFPEVNSGLPPSQRGPVHYSGGVLRTFVDPWRHYFGNAMLRIGPGWQMTDFDSVRSTGDENVTLATTTGPVVLSDMSRSDFFIGADDSIKGIAYGHDDMVLLFQGGPGSISGSTFTGDVTAVSLGHPNGSGMFDSSFSTSASFDGRFAGQDGRSMLFEFDRVASYHNSDERLYGVGMGGVKSGSIGTDVEHFTGYMDGVWKSGSGDFFMLSHPNLHMSYQATPTDATVSGTVLADGDTYVMDFQETGAANIFISKDVFFTTAELNTVASGGNVIPFASNAPAVTPLTGNTLFCSLPDLESYSHINWGRWVTRDGTGESGEGYFAGGRIDTAGVGLIPDVSTIAASANPTVHYSGLAMATAYVGTDKSYCQGTASLDVNFNTAGFNGQLSFDNNMGVSLTGHVIGGGTGFAGAAALDGATSSTGSFHGGFYEDEAAGTFSTTDTTTTLTGAFGGQADETIPLTNR